MKPLLLDGCCKAGGAGMGYYLAGFDVIGVDIEPQPKFPFWFHQADIMDFIAQHGKEFDAIHVSPPCQAYTPSTTQWRKEGKEYPDLIEPLRKLLKQIGKPYVIENVKGSPLINPIILDGTMFGMNINRVRLFECSIPIPLERPQKHKKKPIPMGRPVKEGDILTPVGKFSGVEYARKEMGISWMGQKELSQAIPPAYTKLIGSYLIKALSDWGFLIPEV